LRKEVDDIQARIQPNLNPDDDHHEKLFDVFRQIDAAIAECGSDDEAEQGRAASLIEAQTVIIRTAAALPARCMRDLLYKLAIWRWDAPELDQPVEDMGRADAIAYSAFLDLSKMLGERDVLKDFDKTN
jgi:hypothetical protein